MTKVRYEVEFSGRTAIEFDTDDYPHYFENNEARGGENELATDMFYDHADFRAFPFPDGATEIYSDAIFERAN